MTNLLLLLWENGKTLSSGQFDLLTRLTQNTLIGA